MIVEWFYGAWNFFSASRFLAIGSMWHLRRQNVSLNNIWRKAGEHVLLSWVDFTQALSKDKMAKNSGKKYRFDGAKEREMWMVKSDFIQSFFTLMLSPSPLQDTVMAL